ncbi:DUF4376 domain-containing protein [Enterovibrio norvegicus]|uniref:DUF4376 domain-containing protein n=1 Tax=Enterovibrio norvegicus TaxID=188144 RepID=UPI000CC83E07|nr:DUF4376 domain-containing protein [Enterovibrio norvegicus]PMH60080.1 hypothetical protein BCU62_21915 [Enterovibrio norvegicus]
MNNIQPQSVVLNVSRLSPEGWWLGNEQQHVAKGTALGSDYTESIYRPSSDGLIARFDRDIGEWLDEIEDKTFVPYYSIEGQHYLVGSPDGAIPEGMIETPPPAHDPLKQAVLHDGEQWQIFDIKIGESFWDEWANEYVVSETYFELPESCTWERPPAIEEGYIQRLVDGSWQQIEDHRDTLIYNKAECRHTDYVDDIGPIKEGWTFEEPPTPYHEYTAEGWMPSIDRAKQAKREEINAWRASLENDSGTTVTANGIEWDAGPEARLRIDSTILSDSMPPYWTDANNVDHEGMTIEELKQVKAAINLQGFMIHDRQRTMKRDLDQIAEFDDVLAFSVGWVES